MPTITHADICCGIGTFTLAAKRKSVNTIFAVDKDPYAQRIYALNHEADVLVRGILRGRDVPHVDVLTCSVPCQPFSTCGSRRGHRDDVFINVFDELLVAIRNSKPRVVLIENVRNMKSISKDFDFVLNSLRDVGYENIVHQIVDAQAHFGLPQHRQRLFIVATAEPDLPLHTLRISETNERHRLRNFLLESKNVRSKFYYDRRRHKIFNLVVSKCVEDVRATGAVYYFQHNKIRKFKQSHTCPCVLRAFGFGGHRAPIIRDDRGVRRITPLECARIMGFDDDDLDFSLVSDKQTYGLLGNAVVLPIAEVFMKRIRDLIM